MSPALIEKAKKLVSSWANAYGGLDYYIGLAKERNNMLELLVASIEEDNQETLKLKARITELDNEKKELNDKIVRLAFHRMKIGYREDKEVKEEEPQV